MLDNHQLQLYNIDNKCQPPITAYVRWEFLMPQETDPFYTEACTCSSVKVLILIVNFLNQFNFSRYALLLLRVVQEM